jgi:hypothetical protein
MRRRGALALAAAGLAGACAGLAGQRNLVDAPETFLTLFAVAFASYVIGLWALAGAAVTRPLLLVVVVGLGCRLVLLAAPPTLSTDAYRYVWDARVAAAGVSPYAYAPTAPELAHLRDAVVFPRLNHPTWRTIYPPAAQAFFRAVYALAPDSVLAMKVAIALAELVALGTLAALLPALGLPAWRLAIYAWNPLLLVELWGSAHLDALAVAAVVGAVLASVKGRAVLAAALLAAGTLVKLYPAALLPVLLGPTAWKAFAVFGGLVVAGYLPLLGLGAEALGSLPRYIRDEHFNPGLTRSLVDDPAVTLLALTAWVLWMASRARDPLGARLVRLAGGAVLLSPNIFPWYVAWLVPFLALAPSRVWIAFTGTVTFAYAFFLYEPWAIPLWARALEFAPLLGAGLGALGLAWRRSRDRAGPTSSRRRDIAGPRRC